MSSVPRVGVRERKALMLELFRGGCPPWQVIEKTGVTRKTYENYRADDPEFRAEVNAIRARIESLRKEGKDPSAYEMDFASWRKKYLGLDTYPHQQMWVDVLEGREVVPFHPAIQVDVRERNRLLITTPPGHAKSATITQQWVTYRLCQNPALRVLIVSKTKDLAAKFLWSVRQYLTDPAYFRLQHDYAPEGGFRPAPGRGAWKETAIFLAGRSTDAVDSAAKDPSVQAVGIGGQIYGSRSDLTIVDDAVDETNVHGYVKQFDWLTRTVLSRGRNSLVAVVGTRIAPTDLYSYLMKDTNYSGGRSPWTRVSQPAVLEFAEDPADWVTLWPRSSTPYDETGSDEPDVDGMFPAFDGPTLSKVRAGMRPGLWALVYMQQDVSEDMTFHPACVWGSVDGRRKPGPLIAGAWGHPANGGEGFHTILSIDPAGTGEAFMVCVALDPVKRERWVLQAWQGNHTKPSWYADRIEEIVPAYGVNELVIESNAYASWLIEDERVTSYCQQVGVRILPSFTTGASRTDPDFGIATMEAQFGTLRPKVEGGELVHQKNHTIHLPDPSMSPAIRALIDQLLVWVPGRTGRQLRQDGPMALWFASMRASAYFMGRLGDRPPVTHLENRFAPSRVKDRRMVQRAG